MELDRFDRQILRELQHDSDISMQELGNRVGLSHESFKKTVLGKAARRAVESAVQRLVTELGGRPWHGRVVEYAGGSVVINAGATADIVEERLYCYRDHSGIRLTLRPKEDQIRDLEKILDKHGVFGADRERSIERHAIHGSDSPESAERELALLLLKGFDCADIALLQDRSERAVSTQAHRIYADVPHGAGIDGVAGEQAVMLV